MGVTVYGNGLLAVNKSVATGAPAIAPPEAGKTRAGKARAGAN